jgi:hypothetical protein
MLEYCEYCMYFVSTCGGRAAFQIHIYIKLRVVLLKPLELYNKVFIIKLYSCLTNGREMDVALLAPHHVARATFFCHW